MGYRNICITLDDETYAYYKMFSRNVNGFKISKYIRRMLRDFNQEGVSTLKLLDDINIKKVKKNG